MNPLGNIRESPLNRDFDRRAIVGAGLIVAAVLLGGYALYVLWGLFSPLVAAALEVVPHEYRGAILPVTLWTVGLVGVAVGGSELAQRSAKKRTLARGKNEAWIFEAIFGSFAKIAYVKPTKVSATIVDLVQRSTRKFLVRPSDVRLIGRKIRWGSPTIFSYKTRAAETNPMNALVLAETERPQAIRLLRAITGGGTVPAMAFITLGVGTGWTGLTRTLVLAKDLRDIKARCTVITLVVDTSKLTSPQTIDAASSTNATPSNQE